METTEKDFTKSTRTKAGYPVKGLFVDGDVIKGFCREEGISEFQSRTWIKSTGQHAGIGVSRDLDLIYMPEQSNNSWQDWISASRSPENDQLVLVAYIWAEQPYIGTGYYCQPPHGWYVYTDLWNIVTHWMPLPEMPKLTKSESK